MAVAGISVLTPAALIDAVRQEVRLYALEGLDTGGMFIADEQQHIYAALALFDRVYDEPPPVRADVIVLARVIGSTIIIDEDRTDKPLIDALMINAGVPEAQIICAYAGESPPPTLAPDAAR